MAATAASSSQPIQNCLWCSQPLIGIQQLPNCSKHSICNKCKIINRSCQSTCPCCWYDNGSEFVTKNNICPVCCNNLKTNDGIATCYHKHKHCSQCPPSGCNLCKFIQLRSWVHSTFDTLPLDIQPIVRICDTWEKQFEVQQSNPNAIYSRQESSLMDVDDNPVSTQNSQLPNPTTQNTGYNNCPICLDSFDATTVSLPACHHDFHRECIEKWFQSNGKQSCPTCGFLYGINKGPQPAHGQMTTNYLPTHLAGYPTDQYAPNEPPTIEITYTIPSGIQGPLNPQPGQPYTGTVRKAYLPNNPEGKYVLQLLRRAFDDQHVFTIGISTTTGRDNVVTWNDIHHKTSMTGGAEQFGYPDPTYLTRIRKELADKGYK